MTEVMWGTIPCDRCFAQVNWMDWREHSEQCVFTGDYFADVNETLSIAELPCEFCHAQVSLDHWDSHWNKCANEARRQLENSTVQFLPHRTMQNLLSTITIPCEFCKLQISGQDWESHTNQCIESEKRWKEDVAKHTASETLNATIPCECCDESFSMEKIEEHQRDCQRQQTIGYVPSNAKNSQLFNPFFPFPAYWNLSSPNNVTRFVLNNESDEHKFVSSNFHQTLPLNRIVRIERIQNQRWYRQYDAQRDDFIERYGHSTEQWLFHGCSAVSAEAIVSDCFNRSYSSRHVMGQGIYFAKQASLSYGYASPDENNLRRIFLVRALVGRTAAGDASTRTCPSGFDTTGDPYVIVTYHDAQAYGEYLITFQ